MDAYSDSLAIEAATKLICKFEGYVDHPYQCSAKVWTIGYGTTRYPNGERVSPYDKGCTDLEARKWLSDEIKKCLCQVERLITVHLNRNQMAALISFVYNLGAGNLNASTLRSKLNRRDYVGASNEFRKWVYAGGRKLKGLERRREAERELFVRPVNMVGPTRQVG